MVLVEVIRKAYLASIVPVIVNSVLDSHQLIVDIVAFVSKGDFPRSRLGEKQRGKILGAWVTRKMRTIAQFSIRDDDGTDSQITEVAEPRSGAGSITGVGSSLTNVETVNPSPRVEHAEGVDYTALPTGISEMPATYESSIVGSPPLPPGEEDRDDTPTDPRSYHHNDYPQSDHNDGSSLDDYDDPQDDPYLHEHSDLPLEQQQQLQLTDRTEEYPEYLAYTAGTRHNGEDTAITPRNLADASTFDFNTDPPPPAARYDNKPVLSQPHQFEDSYSRHHDGALASLPSQQRQSSDKYVSHYNNGVSGNGEGGLHVANEIEEEEDASNNDDWRQEALMQMNLARDGSRTGGREGTAGDRGGFVAGDYDHDTHGSSGRRDGHGGGYDHAM